jgi:hypothetical protein
MNKRWVYDCGSHVHRGNRTSLIRNRFFCNLTLTIRVVLPCRLRLPSLLGQGTLSMELQTLPIILLVPAFLDFLLFSLKQDGESDAFLFSLLHLLPHFRLTSYFKRLLQAVATAMMRWLCERVGSCCKRSRKSVLKAAVSFTNASM